jgi:hypothetical protein
MVRLSSQHNPCHGSQAYFTPLDGVRAHQLPAAIRAKWKVE